MKKKYWLLTLILILAFFIRAWHIEILTSFQGDQGRDLFAVYQIVAQHDLKFLGPPSTFGPYQGPLYYYFLVPGMFLSQLAPIGPLITAVIFNMLSLLLLYLLCERFLNSKVALIASFLFSLSPLVVETGRTLLNAYLGLPVFLGGLYVLLLMVLKNKLTSKYYAFLGFIAGSLVQIHFSFAPFALFCLLMPFATNFGSKTRYYLWFAFMFILASTPQILFEITHGFLSTKLLVISLSTAKAMTGSFSSFASFFFSTVGYLFGKENFFFGLTIFIALVFGVKRNKFVSILWSYLLFFAIVVVVFRIRAEFPAYHYYTSVFPVLLILGAIFLGNLKVRPITALVLIGFGILSVITLNLNRTTGFTMALNWNLKYMEEATDIISSDVQMVSNWNIASLMDGDTNGLPFRYLLASKNAGNYLAFDQYPNSKILYLITREGESSILQTNIWEVKSLRPFKFTKKWTIESGINIYRIERI